jgi:hypothetical protein
LQAGRRLVVDDVLGRGSAKDALAEDAIIAPP